MIDVKNNDISFLKLVKTIIPMAFIAAPIHYIIMAVLSVLEGLSEGFNTFMLQRFFDKVTNSINKDGKFLGVILVLFVLILVLIITESLQDINEFVMENFAYKFNMFLTSKINIKASKLEAISFENKELLEDIEKANNATESVVYFTTMLSSLVTYYIPYFLFMTIYLYNLKPILALAMLMIFIPVVLTQYIKVNGFKLLEDESSPIRREYSYYENCIASREMFKETRLLGAFAYFKDLYHSSIKMLNKAIWKTQKKIIIIEIIMKSITLLGYMGIIYLLISLTIKNEISIGAFGAVFASIGTMFRFMQSLIYRHLGNITKDLGTVKNLVMFLEAPEIKRMDVTIEEVPSIVLNSVSFTYPGAKKPAINNVSLAIKAKETIAIVGENGAGKSTLVNLITGIYKPTEGSVLFAGFDTTKVSSNSIYKNVSAVFQKFQKYKLTLGENVSISDVGNKENLQLALEKADFKIDDETFIQGYNTMLSREFDGIDLSGGQWQRIAIARGFYRIHNTIVLDEPTASIDPLEETNIYNKFAEMSKNKTAIIVTHRLGSAKIANRIIVMDKGKIVEIGTHEELINQNGKYAQMYEAQSKWYIET